MVNCALLLLLPAVAVTMTLRNVPGILSAAGALYRPSMISPTSVLSVEPLSAAFTVHFTVSCSLGTSVNFCWPPATRVFSSGSIAKDVSVGARSPSMETSPGMLSVSATERWPLRKSRPLRRRRSMTSTSRAIAPKNLSRLLLNFSSNSPFISLKKSSSISP
ncbi:hypothetical protein D3C80_1323240 [compost metagenome]